VPGPPFAKLRRKRPANNPIGDRYLEMSVAPDASNRLVAHLCESGTGSNVNLLLSFTARAFHRHHNIVLVGHRWVPVRILPCARYGSGSLATTPHLVGEVAGGQAVAPTFRNLPLRKA
jgi:hypothetical protein